MRHAAHQFFGQKTRLGAAWLLLCALLFSATSPFASAHQQTAAATPAHCRMASTPKPCCCPIDHKAAAANQPALVVMASPTCPCSVHPVPVAPADTSTPARLADAFSPFGLTPPLLQSAHLPHITVAVASPRPAFMLGPPLRSPPRAPDAGRAPPAFLSL